MDVGRVTTASLQAMFNSEAARARLASVERLELLVSKIEESFCVLLPLLFPRLRALLFSGCVIQGNSLLSRLMPGVKLRSLALDGCSFQGSSVSEALAGLVGFKSLENLHIAMNSTCETKELPIAQLSELQLLRSLRLDHCIPIGLDVLLETLPLHELQIFDVSLPEGFQLVSNSLQSFVTDRLSLSFWSALPHSGLPALRSLKLLSNPSSCAQGSLECSDAADMKDVFLSLAFPLAGCGELNLVGSRSWSSASCLSVLHTLFVAPTAEFFTTVEKLTLVDWSISPGFMPLLSALFPNIKYLQVADHGTACTGSCAYSDYNSGLIDAVSSMKSLLRIDLSLIDSDGIPCDCLKALLAAQKDGRSFQLCLRVKPELRAAVKTLQEEFWALFKDQAGSNVSFTYECDEESDWTE